MNSESGRKFSLEELKTLNRSPTANPPAEIKVECTIPPELAEELIGLMELTVRELREITARLGRLSTEEERKRDRRLLEQIAAAVEQAGKKRERHFSLPRFQFPEFHLMWLLAIPVATGLLVGCYALWHSWDVLSNFFRPLFQ